MLLAINKILWGITTIMILVISSYFSIKLRFIQFRFGQMLKFLFSKTTIGKDSMSPIESLNISLAARIGVGSLAGIALSIYLGGIGTIFWIWISALISAPNAFAESLLGVVYRNKDEQNIFRGGPPYYIKYGLGNMGLAKLSALAIAFAYIIGFITVQANTIVKSVYNYVNIYPSLIALFITIISALIIFGGIKKIAIIASVLVPIMGGIYCLASLYIIIMNYNQIPTILFNIVTSAFNVKAFGASLITVFIIGIQRGVFSNEAGLGTSAIAAATTTVNKPYEIGLIQVLGVYFTSLVICTITALVILTSNYEILLLSDINGIEITLYAFKYHLGLLGELIVIITIILFAYSTIITGYYYGESCFKFLLNKVSLIHLIILRTLTTILIFIGSIMSSIRLWRFVDIVTAVVAIINLYALFLLRRDIFYEVEYSALKKKCDTI